MTTALAAMLWLGLSSMPCAPGIADTTAAQREPERIEKLRPARVVPVINPERHGYLALDDYFRLDPRFLLDKYETIYTWSLSVYYWPEWGGCLVALCLLIGLFLALRVWRRRRDPDRPYCRKCNYCLSGSNAEQCPECGAEVAGRGQILGKPLWRRLIVAALLGIVPALTYGVLHLAQAPRESEFNYLFAWQSTSLLKWADENKVSWLQRRRETLYRFSELDINTGQVETVFESEMPIPVPSRDGKSFLFVDFDYALRWDIDQKQMVDRLRLREPSARFSWSAFDGYNSCLSLDGRTFYSTKFFNPFGENPEFGMVAYDLQSGEARDIVDESERKRILQGPAVAWPTAPGSNLYLRVNGEFKLDDMEMHKFEANIEVINGSGEPVSKFSTDIRTAFFKSFFSTDGMQMCLASSVDGQDAFDIWDLTTGKKSQTLLIAGGGYSVDGLWLSSRQRFALVYQNSIGEAGESRTLFATIYLLYDLRLGKPIAELEPPFNTIVWQSWFDDEARTFYMLTENDKGNLVVAHYDLSKFMKPMVGKPNHQEKVN